MTDKRISWIDIAKSFSLLIVILIHSTPRNSLSAILTGCVMPAFFILYGVAHNCEKHRYSLKNYISSRFRALMIPYFILSLFMIIFYEPLYPQLNLGFTPVEAIYWFLYGSGPLGRVSHLWFLRTMFFAIILFSVVDRYLYSKSSPVRFIILLGAPVLGVSLKYATNVVLVPWGLDSILISLSFIMIGNEIQRVNQLSSWSVDLLSDGALVLASLIAYVPLSMYNGFVNIGESLYGQSIFVYIITGVLGTYVICVLSYHISKNDLLVASLAIKLSKYGQEVYEIHPLMIEFNVQLFGGLAIISSFTIFQGIAMVFINFITALLFSYLISSRVITRSSILQIMFLGKKIPPPINIQE
jgi:fucose 4-O-acetylase-like acetyltransferase